MFENYLKKFDQKIILRFNQLKALIEENGPVEEKLWANIPSFYHGKNFVRIHVFKTHVNIEANASSEYQDILKDYRFTPKGMLSIRHDQELPNDILKKIFIKSLM